MFLSMKINRKPILLMNENKMDECRVADVGMYLPTDLLKIVEQYTRRSQPKDLLEDIVNNVYYLNKLDAKSKEMRNVLMHTLSGDFEEIQVPQHNGLYISIVNYIEYAFELYPYYPSFDELISRSYFGRNNKKKHDLWRNNFHKQTKPRYQFGIEGEDDREQKVKRLCRLVIGLCSVDERDKLLNNM
jgi:hypothetical protein